MNDSSLRLRHSVLIKEEPADLEHVRSAVNYSEPLDFSTEMTIKSFPAAGALEK